MSVTIGQYEYTLDPKNRLVAPPAYRKALEAEKGSHFILATSLERCIMLFTPSQWERFQEAHLESSKSVKDKSKARAVRRWIFSSAAEAPLDDQGRMLVPQHLKDHALLSKDVVVIGVGDKAEIWDQARWNSYKRKEAPAAMASLAKDIDL